MDFWLIVVIAFAAALVIGFGIVIRRGRADAVSGSPSSGAVGVTLPTGLAPMGRESLDAAAGALLAEGKLVAAVKLIRDQTGLGVAQSKEYVERLAAGADSGAAAPAASTRSSISSEAMAQIQELVAQGKKIQAIKLAREHTGLGLKQAKDLVDRMADSGVVGALDLPTAGPQQSPSTDEVMARVRALAAQGKKINAIKELRDHTPGLGLKEAKDIVERL